MSGTALTARLRLLACVSWSLGLGVLAFDFLSVPVLEWNASAGYAFFLLSAVSTAWAEKREFGTRVALYRLHDATIYSPWKFLLLYFLWISVFSPFTSSPVNSIVYAANGWLSLLAIGLTAQFVFSERTENGIVLLPWRLALAFWCYGISVSLMLANTLVHLAFPAAPFPMLVGGQANLFLYFTLGLPFLLWDFLKDGRRMVPRWLSGLTMVMGSVATLLLNRRFYLLAILVSVAAIFGLFLFKRIRPRRALLLGALVAGWGLAAGFGFLVWLEHEGLRSALENTRLALAERMKSDFLTALEAAWRTRGLGLGLGIATVRGVWTRVLAEAGLVGLMLYSGFFAQLLWDLYRVRRSSRVVVSNVCLISVAIFLGFVSHYVENPYGAYVLVWYGIWTLFASTAKKKRAA
ncbi:MAG TPA: hypothetical protein VIH99_13605 [Bdellovibrionota bacterium]|jgi:hypothetical protein